MAALAEALNAVRSLPPTAHVFLLIAITLWAIVAGAQIRKKIQQRISGRKWARTSKPRTASGSEPRVIVEVEPAERRPFNSRSVRNRKIFVNNRGPIDAFNVEVAPLQFHTGQVHFHKVPALKPDEPVLSEVTIKDPLGSEVGVLFQHDWEGLLLREWNSRDDLNPDTIVFPISISYRDHSDFAFLTTAVFSYNPFADTAEFQDFRFEVVGRRELISHSERVELIALRKLAGELTEQLGGYRPIEAYGEGELRKRLFQLETAAGTFRHHRELKQAIRDLHNRLGYIVTVGKQFGSAKESTEVRQDLEAQFNKFVSETGKLLSAN